MSAEPEPVTGSEYMEKILASMPQLAEMVTGLPAAAAGASPLVSATQASVDCSNAVQNTWKHMLQGFALKPATAAFLNAFPPHIMGKAVDLGDEFFAEMDRQMATRLETLTAAQQAAYAAKKAEIAATFAALRSSYVAEE